MTRETECQSRVHENRGGKIRYAREPLLPSPLLHTKFRIYTFP